MSAKIVTSPAMRKRSIRVALQASATTRTRLSPCSFSQAPTVETLPGPKATRGGRIRSMGAVRSEIVMVFALSSVAEGGRQLFGIVDRLDQAQFVGDAVPAMSKAVP
jgi:hypothetical protein